MKLSTQDKKDLDKYTKFLALKSAQIIVQSRLGEKISTQCRPQTSGTDWVKKSFLGFNLHIRDLPDVLAETRKALNGEVISTNVPLCIEISLSTAEGDQMVLESWCLSLQPGQCDPTTRMIHTVYNRMGILLKSLVSVTRVTPAYKLSRRQGPDSYVICYRILTEQPQFHTLGEGYKSLRIGQICTPIGTVVLSVAYRTKMTISPTQTGRDTSMMLKSDHFNSNTSPRIGRRKQNDKKVDMSKPMRPGAFADPEDKYQRPPQLPIVTHLLSLCQRKSKSDTNPDSDESTEKPNGENVEDEVVDSNSSSEISKESVAKTVQDCYKNDQYWLKPLKAPFSDGGPYDELVDFIRLVNLPVTPDISPEKPLTQEDVKKQLDMFESKLGEYDELVQSLCQSPENN